MYFNSQDNIAYLLYLSNSQSIRVDDPCKLTILCANFLY